MREIFFIILLLLSIDLCFGIVGAVILSKNHARDEPNDVWTCVLIQDIFFFLLFMGFGNEYNVTRIINPNGTVIERKTLSDTSLLLSMANFAISIWGMILAFQMKKESRKIYKDNYPDLWNYLQAVAIYYIIIYTLIGVILICYLITK